jgi:phage-related protein
MVRLSRPVSWLKAALKDFQDFPLEAQQECKVALGLAAEGGKADIAKPLRLTWSLTGSDA